MNHLNRKQEFDVYSHRRKAMGESTLFVAAGYASTQIATVIAKSIGLTSIHYSVIGMIIGIVFTVTVVIYIISQIRKYPSKTFANVLFFIQTAVWGIMYAVWIFNLNEIRTSTLFFRAHGHYTYGFKHQLLPVPVYYSGYMHTPGRHNLLCYLLLSPVRFF